MRTRGFSVALVGLDGAGKSTLAARLPEILPFETRPIYMGVNLRTSRVMLPTTRLLLWLKVMRGDRPEMTGYTGTSAQGRLGVVSRLWTSVRRGIRLLNLIAEEWFRQLIAWFSMRRGKVVIFDRHFVVDYYFHDIEPQPGERPLMRRVHGFSLKHLRRPDLILHLDAPVEVLLDRKPDTEKEWLEERSVEYRRLADVLPGFWVLDATKSAEDVVRDAATIIVTFAETML